MRELYSIQQHADAGLAATAALLTAHQSAKVVDENAVLQLSAYLEVRSTLGHALNNSSQSLYLPVHLKAT